MTWNGKGTAARAGVSLALLVPCFWQPRIEAGDLSSHIYNAWLAQLIARGQAPGIVLVPQYNNVLFDWMLSGLMAVAGAPLAQRLSVALAVLLFFWGAFAFVRSRIPGRGEPWALAPCLAMLAYGWVFRMGFFNFYMALGLVFGALALARRARPVAWLGAAALCAAAYVAHPLPLAWGAGVLVYEAVARALPARHRSRLMFGVVAALALTGFLLARLFETRRGSDQLLSITGAEQLWIYGWPYAAMSVALLTIWGLAFYYLVSRRGFVRILLDIRFEVWVLGVAALLLLPAGVLLPGYRSGLDFLAERMSLAGAVVLCSLLGSVRLPRSFVLATGALALVYFAVSYADESKLNRLEARVESVVAGLPPQQRVVSALDTPQWRVRGLTHMVDRACVDHCFSYGNYEPCTWQFRVRTSGPNPVVAANYGDSLRMQTGGYIVQPADLPLFQIDVCGSRRQLCPVPVRAGQELRMRPLNLGTGSRKEGQPFD